MPNAKDNHETAYLANIEEPQLSTSRSGQGQGGARRLRSPKMAGDSSHSDIDSDPNSERQSHLSVSESSDSGEERASRRRHSSKMHKRKSKKSRKRGKKRHYIFPSSCYSLSETSSDTHSDDAPSHPARRRKHHVRSRYMRNGSPSDSGMEQNGGRLSLHDANLNSADHSEDSDDSLRRTDRQSKHNATSKLHKPSAMVWPAISHRSLHNSGTSMPLRKKTGDDINNAFASIGLRRQPSDKRLLELMEDYPWPRNAPFLIVPKTDEFAHNKLSKKPKVVDGLIQKIQTVMSKAPVSLMHEISDMGDKVIRC